MKYLPLLFFICFLSCDELKQGEEKPLARVFDEYLYPSHLNNKIPLNTDSVTQMNLRKDYIEKWVREKLILHEAEQSLSDEDKNVDEQIENYRISLLIYRYKQQIINEELDTVVSSEEIKSYYEKNPSNFILNKNIVKAIFLKIPKQSPDIDRVHTFYKFQSAEDSIKLMSYAEQYASIFDVFNNDWIDFTAIAQYFPQKIQGHEWFIRSRKYYYTMDSEYFYFLRILDYSLNGNIAPLDYVENNIRSILMNKRKIQLINNLESTIYKNASNKDNFRIY